MTPMDRRTFLHRSAGLAAALSFPGCHAPSLGEETWFRISLAQWSLHRAHFSGDLAALDFPAKAAELGFSGVEYVNAFFMDKAKDSQWLGELKIRATDAGTPSLLIMCDREGMLGNPNKKQRGKAVQNHHKWVDAAAFLGCHSIRVNASSTGSAEEQERLAADGLRQLTEFGAQANIHVIVENHGGLSSNGAWLARVMQRVDHPGCGTLPDFGNFNLGGGNWYDRYQGVEELMPYAKAVSAKSHEFDAEGWEIRTDYPRMLNIVKDAGYRSFIGVEFEGNEYEEEEGILLTKDLLLRLGGKGRESA